MSKDANTTLSKIKQSGYWIVQIFPDKTDENFIESPLRCKELVEKASIHYRGWDYPHVPRQTDDKQDIYIKENSVEAWIEWEEFEEVWRYYQNGKFIHIFSVMEDLYHLSDNTRYSRLSNIKPKSIIDVTSINWRVTEIFEFLRALILDINYDGDYNISIELRGMNGRQLVVLDPAKIGMSVPYICRSDKIKSRNYKINKKNVFVEPERASLEVIEHIYQQFQWTHYSREQIAKDQKKLIDRQF